MVDEINSPPPPLPPVISSFYGSEQDTEAFEQAIADIMLRENCDRDRATQLYQLED